MVVEAYGIEILLSLIFVVGFVTGAFLVRVRIAARKTVKYIAECTQQKATVEEQTIQP